MACHIFNHAQNWVESSPTVASRCEMISGSKVYVFSQFPPQAMRTLILMASGRMACAHYFIRDKNTKFPDSSSMTNELNKLKYVN
jgi:hypothetical protein